MLSHTQSINPVTQVQLYHELPALKYHFVVLVSIQRFRRVLSQIDSMESNWVSRVYCGGQCSTPSGTSWNLSEHPPHVLPVTTRSGRRVCAWPESVVKDGCMLALIEHTLVTTIHTCQYSVSTS